MREFSSVRGPQSRVRQRAATSSTVARSLTRWPTSHEDVNDELVWDLRVLMAAT